VKGAPMPFLCNDEIVGGSVANIVSLAEGRPYLRSSMLNVRELLCSCVPSPARGRERFLWLTNFECEQFWTGPDSARLLSFSSPTESAIVNHMEEMCLWLAGKPDAVILRQAPDPDFLSYLTKIGIALPEIVNMEPDRASVPISQAVLSHEEFCSKLGSLKETESDFFLLAYGNTWLEEKISNKTQIPLFGAEAAVSAMVNSKIFSRRLSKALGLPTVPGYECESLEELEWALQEMRPQLSAGNKIVLKEAMGVSGKGLIVIERPEKLHQLLDLFRRRHKPGLEYAFVVEQWIDKQADINYQILVAPAGGVRFLAIKESFALGGVHAGHRCPPELNDVQMSTYRAAALAIGKELHRAGYHGIAGIDSVIGRDGRIYPMLEINARFNMSTYQLALEGTLEPGSKFIVKNYPLVLQKPLRFQDVADGLGSSLFGLGGRMQGVGVMCFATVNCNITASANQAKGRLYVFIVGKDFSEIHSLDLKTQNCLAVCGATVSAR
jgi:D-alanine-D-alanine ligase-like ATP-grasp enzyme